MAAAETTLKDYSDILRDVPFLGTTPDAFIVGVWSGVKRSKVFLCHGLTPMYALVLAS